MNNKGSLKEHRPKLHALAGLWFMLGAPAVRPTLDKTLVRDFKLLDRGAEFAFEPIAERLVEGAIANLGACVEQLLRDAQTVPFTVPFADRISAQSESQTLAG